MNVTSIPTQVHGRIHGDGYDGRYRLYTHENVAFDDVTPYGEGGPSLVAHSDWHTSTSSTSRLFSSREVVALDDGMHTVRASREGHYEMVDGEQRYVTVKHDLDGQKFATKRDADRAKFDAGLVAFMVYDRKATEQGFPVE